MKKIYIVIALVILVAIVGFIALRSEDAASVANFEECRDAGYPIMESYPERCATPDGRTFTRVIGAEGGVPGAASYKDMIRITSIEAGDTITSPVTVRGEARGTWFFEATFPVAIASSDPDGRYIAQGYAQADGEWMTTEYVPFSATVAFDPGSETEGFIVFEKANASGLPEFSDAFQIPVRFARPQATGLTACRTTGCSGQICAEEDIASDCMFRPEYACYKESFARCERQANGRCGWTENSELSACVVGKVEASLQSE